jgi:hypothetical protein
MKKVTLIQMEQLQGGICISPGPSGQCLPCEAILQALNALHSTGDPIVCPA